MTCLWVFIKSIDKGEQNVDVSRQGVCVWGAYVCVLYHSKLGRRVRLFAGVLSMGTKSGDEMCATPR